MRRKLLYCLALTVMALSMSSCGVYYTTSYSTSPRVDGIYYRPTTASRIAVVESTVPQYNETPVEAYFETDPETGRIYLAEGISYEELLRKFDSPTYTVNINYGGWYDPWYNPWWGSWRYRSRYHYYSPYYSGYWYSSWYDPWYYDSYCWSRGYYYGGWYSTYSWYDPWYWGSPYCYHYYHHPYHYHHHHHYGHHHNDPGHYGGHHHSNYRPGTVYGHRSAANSTMATPVSGRSASMGNSTNTSTVKNNGGHSSVTS